MNNRIAFVKQGKDSRPTYQQEFIANIIKLLNEMDSDINNERILEIEKEINSLLNKLLSDPLPYKQSAINRIVEKFNEYNNVIIKNLVKTPPKFNKDAVDESNNQKDKFDNTYNKFEVLVKLVNTHLNDGRTYGSRRVDECIQIKNNFEKDYDAHLIETYDQKALLGEIDKLIIDINNLTEQLTVDNAENINKDFQFISDHYKKLLTQMTMHNRTTKSERVAKAFNEYKTKIGAITPKNRWPSFSFKSGGKRKSHRTKKNAYRKLVSRKLVNKKRASNKKRGTQKRK